jgi:hypothetical protein
VFNPLYRFGQVLRGIRTTIPAVDAADVGAMLTREELALFLASHSRDRVHSIRVMRWLWHHASPSDELIAAALLHDVSKGQPSVLDRSVFAVLEALSLRLTDRVAAEHGIAWRRRMWQLRHHPRIAADALRLAGSEARVIELVELHAARRSAQAGSDADLALLITADGAC